MAKTADHQQPDPIARAAAALAADLMPGFAQNLVDEIAALLRRLAPDLTLRPAPLDRTAAARQRRCQARKRAAWRDEAAAVPLSFGA